MGVRWQLSLDRILQMKLDWVDGLILGDPRSLLCGAFWISG